MVVFTLLFSQQFTRVTQEEDITRLQYMWFRMTFVAFQFASVAVTGAPAGADPLSSVGCDALADIGVNRGNWLRDDGDTEAGRFSS